MFVKIPLSSRKVRIDRRKFLAEVIPFGGDIRPQLLTRPQSLFLTTNPWRRSARQTLDSLISSPVLAVNARGYSASIASCLSHTSDPSSAPSTTSSTDRKPRPYHLATDAPSHINYPHQAPAA